MRQRRHLIILLFVLIATMPAMGQNGINSPFSQYGIGASHLPFNMPAATALGGVVYSRSASNMVNPFNPASYGAVASETLIFDMGLNIEMSTLRDNANSQYDADGNIGYLTVAFPLSKWWKTSLGVMPVSEVSYQSTLTSSINPGGEVKTIYEGTGGVSRFFWGHGFNILGGTDPAKTQLRAGFNINYLYGSLTRAVTYDFVANDTTFFMDSRRQKDTYVKNLVFDLGMQYEQPIGEKYRFMAGITLTPSRKMTVRDNALVYTFVTQSGSEYMRDTIFPVDGDSEFESTLEQPFTTGLGLAFQRNDKWLVAFDATLAPWNGLKYTENSSYSVFGQSPIRYDNTSRLALGFQLLGDRNAAKYLRRMTFSLGTHYEKGCLKLQLTDGNEYRLDEWGVALGVSMPMRKGRSVLNITAGYTSYGTIDLLRRDTFTFGISVGSCESWFVKRKFN